MPKIEYPTPDDVDGLELVITGTGLSQCTWLPRPTDWENYLEEPDIEG